MSDPAVVSCLHIPSQPIGLLLPSIYVAEVVAVSSAEITSGGESCLARLMWRHQSIPILSIGLIVNQKPEVIAETGRFVILYPLADDAADAFFAIYVDSDPKTHLVDEDLAQRNVNMDQHGSIMARMFVEIENETVAIPDLKQLQQSVLAAKQ